EVAGHVRALLVEAGATVPVGTPVAVITPGPDDPFEVAELVGVADVATSRPSDDPAGSVATPPVPANASSTPAAAGQGGSFSPVVARLLAEHGIDPSTVR